MKDYNLDFKDCPGTYKVQNDPNSTVRNTVLNPQGRLALLFDIECAGNITKRVNTGGNAVIFLTYKFCTQSGGDPLAEPVISQDLVFQHKLKATRQPIDFVIECQHAPSVFKGKRIDFYWTITSLREANENANDFGERYTIKVDNKLWLIAAKTNGNIDFVKTEKGMMATAKCTLIPLVCGILPLPQFRVETTSMARIRELNSKQDSILVYPVPVITSLCEIEIGEKRKTSLLKKDVEKKEETISVAPKPTPVVAGNTETNVTSGRNSVVRTQTTVLTGTSENK